MLAEWWNGVELWVLGLAFPFQFALVIVLLAPLCLVVAWLIDRIVDHASGWFGSSDTEDDTVDGTGESTEPPAEEHSEDLVDSASR